MSKQSTYKDEYGLFRTWVTASDGSCLLGTGANAEQSEAAAKGRLESHEAFLSLSASDKLRLILNKEHILDNDQQLCIRLLSEIVLGVPHRREA